MSSGFGNKIRIQIFGQSHSESLGVIIDGLPADEMLDMDKVHSFLEHRRGGKSYSTSRIEADDPYVVSGIVNNKTCGAPLCCLFRNRDARSRDYTQHIPRPSHADYNAYVKYNGANDYRGGGHFSGRLTLPLCFAGAVCMQILERRGVKIGAHIASIGDVYDTPYDPINITLNELTEFSVNDPNIRYPMLKAISDVVAEGDSIGGTVECAIVGMPQAIGEPMFDGVESRLSSILFGIPAIKGVEFGSGFGAAKMKGSEHNDAYFYNKGKVEQKSNNAGGVLGGITTGLPIIFRVAVKPTPSISIEQDSVNLILKENIKLNIHGRHDPCIVPRAVPCVMSAAAIAMLDMLV